MTAKIRPETKKEKAYNVLKIILNVVLFILLIITVAYFFIHSPAIVNKVNNILNHDQQSQNLQEALSNENILENTIIVPQANVYAPIIEVNPNNPDEVEAAINQGLAAWKDDSKLMLAGNYSDYFWKEGDYKYILSAMGNIENGDLIGVNLNGEFIKYRINDTKIIKAKEFSELNNIDADLIIASDWPPGLTRYKLVLEAERTE